MPEYLAPGVYVEEVSFRSKSIEGVSTTTTGFIGPARFGPIDLPPDLLTSLGEFERIYGDRQRLRFGASFMDNYLWHGARAFFEEGGKRLYVQRVFRPLRGEYPPKVNGEVNFQDAQAAPRQAGFYDDGHARRSLPGGGGVNALQVRARFPGAAGNAMLVRFTLRLNQNTLGGTVVKDANGTVLTNPDGTPRLKPTVGALLDNDVVWISDATSPISSPPGSGSLFLATSSYDVVNKETVWSFRNGPTTLQLSGLTASLDPDEGDQIKVLTLTVSVALSDGSSLVWDNISLDPRHERDGVPDDLGAYFAQKLTNQAMARTIPLVVGLGNDVNDGLEVLQALFSARPDLRAALNNPLSTDLDRSLDILLEGGNDGVRPGATEYEGQAKLTESTKTGLMALEDLEDISIIAAPGYSFGYEGSYRADASTIANLLISHASRMRYRIAVLDSGNGQTIAQVRALRARIDSKYAALYYPWITVLDPLTRREIQVPPSGFVCGIYARNDINRAVYKAPANEVVNLSIGFETMINKSQQDVLNPEGINCFRFFEGRGYLLWGARTVSSDPEWKYVNLRRYFAYLERSIDKGTQWAVFEPNGPLLWDNVRRTIDDFLLNEWQSGALLGDKPEKSYFVRCDRTTMTQNDLDNGRLICLIGVAPLRPAEFVIFRVGQWTADRRG